MSEGRLRVAELTYTYSNSRQPALDNLDLDVRPGEFLSLLGPSGCGKSTLLRVISGFVMPRRGRVLLDGVDITRVSPNKRPVNLVFQRPTLFPHLDVGENVAFGLKLAGVGRAERRSRVQDVLDLVRLPDFARRRVHQLSGGQMQRVALARALVNEPKVLLLDEPLSALDLAIRLELEVELRRMHRETGATFVYVTHDQREAMALSDRVAVFGRGRLAQLASPYEVYRRPATRYVATFVGDANVFDAEVVGGRVVVAGHDVGVQTSSGDRQAVVVVRREDVVIQAPGDDDPADDALVGKVVDVAFRGNTHTYRVDCPAVGQVVKSEQAGEPVPVGSKVTLTWSPTAPQLLIDE